MRPATSAQTKALPFDPTLFDQEGASLFKALGIHWGSTNSSIYMNNASRADAEALERRYSVRLPKDFRDYLIHAAPKSTFMDEMGTQWWAASEIKSITDECPNGPPSAFNTEIEREKDVYLVFSDYLIWCYAWAICCSDGPNRGKIALIGGTPDTFVADSFRDFLRLELTDDNAIHQGAKGQASVDQ